MIKNVSFIGFGEAAQSFVGAPDWRAAAAAFDIKEHTATTRDHLHQSFDRLSVAGHDSAAALASQAENLISVVTADQAPQAAQSVAEHLSAGSLYLDMNSVAPATKQQAAERISAFNGVYIDVAVMAPVHPAQLEVPLLVSGAEAPRAEAFLKSIGFSNVRVVGNEIGAASTIKMVRSIMIKGIESLSMECMLAASKAGVVDDVLSSLGGDWAERVNYNLERMWSHGERRAAEMEQACQTLCDLEIEPVMSRGTVTRQREMSRISEGDAPDTIEEKLERMNIVWEVAAE